MRIAVIDDERPARGELIWQLRELLGDVDFAEGDSGAAALGLAGEGKYDLFFLDINLGDISGTDLVQAIRSMQPEAGIIFVTAYSEYAVTAFELGVDEYISKPFSPKILVARIEAILRRKNAATGEVLEADGIRVDKDAHVVTVDGKPVELSNKEFELLTYFMENQGIALSREKILNNVWNYDYFGDARTIDTHVKKLRSKLGPKGDDIKTIWGMGYKLEVEGS